MNILQNNQNKKLLLKIDDDKDITLNKSENILLYEKKKIDELYGGNINYEMSRYAHNHYNNLNDILYSFHFYNQEFNHEYDSFDYENVGISLKQNTKMMKESSSSFFKLDFFDIVDSNVRKPIFSKILDLPIGEKVFSNIINDFIYVPIFRGNNYYNKENFFIYWFQNFNISKTNTFYFSAFFFNGINGNIIKLLNKPKLFNEEVDENLDFFYKIVFDFEKNTYEIFDLDDVRHGTLDLPVKFYEAPFSVSVVCDIPEITELVQINDNSFELNYIHNNISCDGIKILYKKNTDTSWKYQYINCQSPVLITLDNQDALGSWDVKIAKKCLSGVSNYSEQSTIIMENINCDTPRILEIVELNDLTVKLMIDYDTNIFCSAFYVSVSKDQSYWDEYSFSCYNLPIFLSLNEAGVWYFKIKKQCGSNYSNDSVTYSFNLTGEILPKPLITNIEKINDRDLRLSIENTVDCDFVVLEWGRTTSNWTTLVKNCGNEQDIPIASIATGIWYFRVKTKKSAIESDYSDIYMFYGG